MNDHIADEIPRLLTGESDRSAVLAASAHLRQCPDCREELIEALTAHASLSSARRFAPDVMTRQAQSWTADIETSAELPDLGAVFEQARAEAANPATRAQARMRSAVDRAPRSRYLLAAAAVVAAAGVGTAVLLDTGSDGSGGRQIALAAYDVGTTAATATVGSNGRMSIHAGTLPEVAGTRYEVWLTDAARTRLQPVGWLDADGTASLQVPGDLMGRYGYLEVSRQQVGGNSYLYSGTSVLRGKYSA